MVNVNETVIERVAETFQTFIYSLSSESNITNTTVAGIGCLTMNGGSAVLQDMNLQGAQQMVLASGTLTLVRCLINKTQELFQLREGFHLYAQDSNFTNNNNLLYLTYSGGGLVSDATFERCMFLDNHDTFSGINGSLSLISSIVIELPFTDEITFNLYQFNFNVINCTLLLDYQAFSVIGGKHLFANSTIANALGDNSGPGSIRSNITSIDSFKSVNSSFSSITLWFFSVSDTLNT